MREIPPALALQSAIENALFALEFLGELEIKWNNRPKGSREGPIIRKKQRVVADALVVYVASLFDKTKGVHSLLKSYAQHQFIHSFENQPIVVKCIEHRHTRTGHQSKKYGSYVSHQEILSSDLKSWLKEARYLVCTHKLPTSPSLKSTH